MKIALILFGLCSLAAAAEPAALVDVYTSGEDGFHTYRIPALIATPRGTLLAFAEGRKNGRADHGDIDLVLKRSEDGGRTWSARQTVHEEGGAAEITIGNPCPVVDLANGVVWLTFTRDNDRVFVTSSSDDGRSWSEPREITSDVKDAAWSWYATGPGNGIQIQHGPHKGRLVFPCDHRVRERAGDWKQAGRSHVIYSDDQGKTFRLGGSADWGTNECAVAELPGGRLLLNMRSYRGNGCRAVATSDDGGETWSETRDEETLIESVCQASLVRYSWPGSPTGSVLLFSNPATKQGRHHLTLRKSTDEGRTWPVSRLIYEGSAAYSNLVPLPDGQAGLIFERDNYSRISFAVVAVEE